MFHLEPTPNFLKMTSILVTAQPVCLMANENVRLQGRKAILVGWGILAGQKGNIKII